MRQGFPEWRKMSRDVREELRNSEDYLTSRTIGMFRFLSTEMLGEVLRRLDIAMGDGRPRVTLWPDERICQPDASIESRDTIVLVESKFVGSRLGFYASQLGREWASARQPG